ncbi:protein of unknown function [Rhizobium sp. RU20A]|uniref:DUF4405 domain-containing protein n=1 Tax=Rhizobium sp. RU20A TaxID=1907412 RepID=UPI00095715C7|nr:DUF4405 domain-containing protein [Rhizobium sp. RU20A]SIQ18186.1 protein of unknown function [Rhizobium sp. RU20A]
MKDLLLRYATPLTTGLFIISLISGVFLFVKIGGPLKGIHEWLSMLLIAPFVLHLWRNWRPFMAYFKRTPMIIAIVISVALTVPFFLDSSSRTLPPYVQFSRTMLKGTPAELAPVLDVPAAEIVALLIAAGYAGAAEGKSFEVIASEAAKDNNAMIATLAGVKPAGN